MTSQIPPQIVDSHCHLDFPDFDGEHEALIGRARAAGVTRMVTICTRLRHEPRVRHRRGARGRLLRRGHPSDERRRRAHGHGRGAGGAGRPSEIRGHRRDGARLSLHARERAGAAGEPAHPYRGGAAHGSAAHHPCPRCGCRHGAHPDRGASRGRLRLRDALLLVGARAGTGGARSGLLPLDVRDRGLPEIGRAAGDLRRGSARAHPARDRQPLSCPPPFRGKRNEPAYTAHTAAKGAEVFGLSLADFAAATSANFDRLFAKAAA